jgi:hypothetical protein
MGARLRVQVPSQVDHDERSEKQLQDGDRLWYSNRAASTVSRCTRIGDDSLPSRATGRLGEKPRRTCDQIELVYIWRLCSEGVCSDLGSSHFMPERLTVSVQ